MLQYLADRPRDGSVRGGVAGPPLISDRKRRLWVEACRQGSDDRAWGNYDLETVSGLDAACDRWSRCQQSIMVNDPLPYRADLLREIVGNPHRSVDLPKRKICTRCNWNGEGPNQKYCPRSPNPDDKGLHRWKDYCPWITPVVVSLAQAAYNCRAGEEAVNRVMDARKRSVMGGCCNRFADNQPCDCLEKAMASAGTLDPVRLAVLADAVEEAGCVGNRCPSCPSLDATTLDDLIPKEMPLYWCGRCDEATRRLPHPVLVHLLSPGQHVRGCWVVDLFLWEV